MVGARALRAAASIWFAVTLVGQWLFLVYVTTLYGAATVTGSFEDWRRKATLMRGYVEGDAIGNLFFAAHILLAIVVLFGGVMQLVPWIRAHAIAVHRWNGRVFLATSAAIAANGLYMVWVRDASWHPVNTVSVSLNAFLVLVFIPIAWRAARAGDLDAHRRWALRTFMAVNGPALFIRVFTAAWSTLAPGVGTSDGAGGPGPMVYFFMFASYLGPLAVLELYLRARGAIAQFATAIAILLFAAYMGVGTYAAVMHRLALVG